MKKKILILLCASILTFSNFSSVSFAASNETVKTQNSENLVIQGSVGGNVETDSVYENVLKSANITNEDIKEIEITVEDLLKSANINLSEKDINTLMLGLEMIGIEDINNLANYLYQNNLLKDMPDNIDGAVKYLEDLEKNGEIPKEYSKTVDKIDLLYNLAGSFLK